VLSCSFAGRRLAALAATLVVALGSRPASACSICRCGDAAFNALGLNIYEPGSVRFALDWDRTSKEQGSAATREAVIESRLTATISYSPADWLTLVGRVPASRRLVTSEGGEEVGRGLSDPEMIALVRLWASPFGTLGRRAWLGAQLGVKTPWGENDLRYDGERLDEHAQPGTGATDRFAGLSGVYVLDPASSLFASAQHRWTGTNGHGYRYGPVTLANVGYERRLSSWLDSVFEVNARTAGRDRVDATGGLDPDTGGALVYLTPEMVVNLSKGLVARISVQVPVMRRLNGEQREDSVYGAGFTYVLGP
jgi:hypothetical protein